MARHAAPKNPMPTTGARRTLLRAGLTMAAAGAAVAAGATGASAAGGVDPLTPLTSAVDASTTYGLAPVKNLQLDPLAGTGVDPLDNAVGTQVADFQPLSTAAVTGPVTSGSSLSELPVVGAATGLLPG
ncbi:hypothetical protein GTW43_32570 [Streptomyces sp. SID5785]|uniref:hypothetical protein n=1 Tax=Streptomyces sp. SID5785 TaxID=2690309 RepID=UPI001361B33A|nr:hypothetical protein [Streptomyces sp. SID5785]MZD09781.1 hypothetical protein [Streptomyces sp. SID5785]